MKPVKLIMNIPLHVQLLESLAKAGIGVNTNISDFMASKFKIPTSQNVIEWNKLARPPAIFLDDLIYRGLIGNDDIDDQIFKPFNAEHLDKPMWYTDYDTIVYITSNGLDYLDKHYLQQSYFSLNGASERNYKSQKIFSVGTIVISLITAIFSIITYKTSKDTNNQIAVTEAKIERLQKQKEQEKLKQSPSQNPKKFLVDSAHKSKKSFSKN